MFTFERLEASAIEQRIREAAAMGSSAPSLLTLRDPLDRTALLPRGFSHDFSRSRIGHGGNAFLRARLAFERWAMFDLGWVRVANREAPITSGQIVAVEAQTLGLWTLNLSRILDTVDEPGRFGFLYATTGMHVEQGEERFLIQIEPMAGAVFYELEAVSRPQRTLAWLGLPLTRSFQRRFGRDSHRRMAEEAVASET